MTKRKAIILVLAAVLLLVALFLFLLLGRSPEVKMTLGQPFLKNVNYPHLKSDEVLYYFNGYTFVKYNLNDKNTSDLTPTLILPNVYNVIWGDSSVVFAANNYQAGDSLYPKIKSSSRRLDLSHWWMIDYKTGAVNVIDSTDAISSIIWQKDGERWIYFTEPMGDSNGYQAYATTNGTDKTLVYQYTSFNVLLWSNKEKIHTTTNKENNITVVETPIPGGPPKNYLEFGLSGRVRVNQNGNEYLYTKIDKLLDEGSELSGKLTHQNGADKPKTIDKQFMGLYQWSSINNSWIALRDNTRNSGYISWDGKSPNKLVIKTPKGFEAFVDVQIGSNFLVLTDINQKAYIASDNKKLLENYTKSVDNSQDETMLIRAAARSIVGKNFTINYYRDDKEYVIMIYSNPYSKYKQEALKLIKDQYQLDPYQLNIIWNAGRGVDSST